MNRAKSKPSIPKASKPAAGKPKANQAKASPLRAAKPNASKPVAPKTDATRSNIAKSSLAKSSLARSSLAKSSLAKSSLAKSPPAKSKPAKPQLAKAKVAQVEASQPAKSKPAKPLLTKGKVVKIEAPKAPRAAAAPPAAAAVTASNGKLANGKIAKIAKPAKPAPPLVRLDTPAMIRPIEQAVGVSSDAVARRTGKSWAQWFQLLDAAGAAELDHKGIVAVLAQRHGVGPWWQQMVTSAYEQARGKRETQAADEGFQVDVVKTLELPLAKLFRFWSEPSERNKWLADDRFSIHKATASKSIRARWGRGVSRIDVDFCEKGPSKSQVTVQHNRIESSDAAEQMKAYWAKKISALEALLTTRD